MKKNISIIVVLFFVSIFICSFASFTKTDFSNKITIITEDSFHQLFHYDDVDEIIYDYQFNILEEDASRAQVILLTSIRINEQSYYIITEGIISSNKLSNEDILWEGPLYGSCYINGKEYFAVAGFSLLDSTKESMISLTLQNDLDIVAIAYGNNIIQNEVLDFYLNKASHKAEDALSPDLVSTTLTNTTILGNNVSTNSIDLRPVQDQAPDGGGAINLGENGEWKYKSLRSDKHSTSPYIALKSGVYFDNTRNILLVTLKPYSKETADYVKSLGYNYANVSLESFRVELLLEDVPASSYAHIEFVDLPNDISDPEDYFDSTAKLLLPLFEDFLGALQIPSSTISTLITEIFDGIKGKVELQGQGLSGYVSVERDFLSSYYRFDDLPHGLPFRFQLSKGSEVNYIANTPYTVNTYAEYFVLAQTDMSYLNNQYIPLYFTASITHEGTVTLT